MKRVLFIIILLFFQGCFISDDGPGPCPDARFVGTWVRTLYWTASDGINETNEYESYEFENSDEGFYYEDIKNYTKTNGWYMHQDDYLFQWGVNGNQLSISLNDGDTWLNPKTFEFKNGSLFLNDKEFKKE